ncbi:Methyltransferase domain-containing protein [Pedobacter steynii]|uniref:Methyltransferase domain-containing protein n=1 Tax=Pedobacter steynii TaxID=430522 RepID=A0A1G9SEZ2_9SPHI|nr:class I SAM-dependent methyltransferase [Pedobacter steynii]NQX37440.1 methyltransferase domain-containing protein [Pedobacter steynii]SDM34056.1 Methyltransferase domain-containing protein [Pedobacter steynii]
MSENKKHWENVYTDKQPQEVSWTQEVPQTSLDFIRDFNLAKTANIIDIGGGDSKLVDFLLDDGYQNITVLDISEQALLRAQSRLGERAKLVTWIASDILNFSPDTQYDLWHDRATLHFLTAADQVKQYTGIAASSVTGFLTIGTFSHDGPKQCSGLEIKQYNEEELQQQLLKGFTKIRCITEDHTTPFETKQNFLFCSFKATAN